MDQERERKHRKEGVLEGRNPSLVVTDYRKGGVLEGKKVSWFSM
jgi:hypothetical protein